MASGYTFSTHFILHRLCLIFLHVYHTRCTYELKRAGMMFLYRYLPPNEASPRFPASESSSYTSNKKKQSELSVRTGMHHVHTLYELQPKPRGLHTKRKLTMEQIKTNQVTKRKREKRKMIKCMTVRNIIRKGQKTREYVDLHARRQAEGGGW